MRARRSPVSNLVSSASAAKHVAKIWPFPLRATLPPVYMGSITRLGSKVVFVFDTRAMIVGLIDDRASRFCCKYHILLQLVFEVVHLELFSRDAGIGKTLCRLHD